MKANKLISPPFIEMYIKTLLPGFANNFVNKQIFDDLSLSSNQKKILADINDGFFCNPVEFLDSYFEDVFKSISQSSLSIEERTPLYLSSSYAFASYQYWTNVFENTSDWDVYLNSNKAINYLNLPHLVSSAFIGSLSSYNQTSFAIKLAPIFDNLNSIILLPASLLGSIGINAGLVIFRWTKKAF
jgi:hypothetical protein